ncbi:MAG: hypothetical protein II800_08330 [Lachnospiraceae bacterium]|nr:hypothetical protein [Lachnospiraceae bacterium]
MSLMQQITQDLQVAEICTGIALLLGLITIALFFALHIPACLRALTGIGRKREIRRMEIADPRTGTADRSAGTGTVRQHMTKMLVMETDIRINSDTGNNKI